MTRILHIDASARKAGSVTRDMARRIVASHDGAQVVHRDLAAALPQIDEAWVAANFTPPDQRSDAQKAALALSDSLVAELRAADVIVIGLPVYNFSVPAAFKAWVDLVARVGETFSYSEQGPKGLLTGKSVVVAAASGGMPIGAGIDFATPYVRHVLGFLGMTDVTLMTPADFSAPGEAAA